MTRAAVIDEGLAVHARLRSHQCGNLRRIGDRHCPDGLTTLAAGAGVAQHNAAGSQ